MKKKTVLLILNMTFSAAVSCRLFSSGIGCDYSSLSTATDSLGLLKRTYLQSLNHFSDGDEKWPQRYAVSLAYYKKAGPAFLYLRASNPMKEGYEFSDNVLTYAKHLNAILFALEHRFYGVSQPVNGSMIHHLNTAQVLADVANFIKGIPKEFHLPKNTKWVVFGCSYGGMMAAWAKRTYSHLIYGAVASSSPLVAKVNYYEYEQIVEESLRSYDSKCIKSITMAFEEISSLVITRQNVEKISQMFDLDVLDSFDIIKTLIVHTMLEIISIAVQNNDFPTTPINISLLCRTMMQYNGTKLDAFAKIKKISMESEKRGVKVQSERCMEGQYSANDEDEKVKEAWRYQRCSEFGYFSSCTNTTFLSPVEHLLIPIELDIINLCEQFFGKNVKDLTEKVDRTNSLYGGLDFNATNTIFIHGSLDPFYKGGLYRKSNGSLYETIFIKGTSHCADTFPSSERDIPELRNARNQVLRTLKSWLIDPL